MDLKNYNETLVVRGEEELNKEKEFVLDFSGKNYVIKVQLVTFNKESYIRIIAQEEKKIVNYNYLIEMNKDDFDKQDNILLSPYPKIQNIFNFIIGSFKGNMVSIKEINNKISFTLIIKGNYIGYEEQLTFEINLKKHDCNKDDIEEMICNKINELEKENKILKNKVDELKEKENKSQLKFKESEENNNLKLQVNELKEKDKKSQLKFKELEKENNNLKFQVNELKEEIHNLTVKSKEIIKSEKEMEFIKTRLNQIPGRENKKVRFELKYRMTEDGDSPQTFHSKCDNIPNNLILIKSSSGARFGGYTDKPWTSSNKHINDNNCFCFSLSNRKIYNVIKDKNGIFDHYNYGPYFYNMIYIGNGNPLSYGYCYGCCPLNVYFSGVNTKYEINGGYSSFIVLELEFYQVIFE